MNAIGIHLCNFIGSALCCGVRAGFADINCVRGFDPSCCPYGGVWSQWSLPAFLDRVSQRCEAAKGIGFL